MGNPYYEPCPDCGMLLGRGTIRHACGSVAELKRENAALRKRVEEAEGVAQTCKRDHAGLREFLCGNRLSGASIQRVEFDCGPQEWMGQDVGLIAMMVRDNLVALRKRVEELEQHRNELIETLDSRTRGWREATKKAEADLRDFREEVASVFRKHGLAAGPRAVDALVERAEKAKRDRDEARALLMRQQDERLKALVEEWGRHSGWSSDDFEAGKSQAYEQCADQLAALLAESGPAEDAFPYDLVPNDTRAPWRAKPEPAPLKLGHEFVAALDSLGRSSKSSAYFCGECGQPREAH